MFHKVRSRTLPQLLVIAVLAITGCTPFVQGVGTGGTAPTPFISEVQDGTQYPDVFVDLTEFQAALLKALSAGDAYQQMEDLYAMVINTFHFTV